MTTPGGTGNARRAVRVTRGLIRAETRDAYVAALRREAAWALDRGRSRERCAVCGTTRVRVRRVTSIRWPSKSFDLRLCAVCGHVANPDNVHDYRVYESEEALPLRARVGTADRPGREFHMARMATEILGRRELDVVVFGAGRSQDNHHIEALDAVRKVAVADIMKVRDDAEFVDLNRPAPRRFDLVVASEVVEHFLEPRKDFAYLTSFVSRDGLIVCSTNVYDGGPIARQPYIFIPGHVSYYSPRALQVLARDHGFHVDFRVPYVATGYGGPRKRYVLLSRSRDVMDAAVLHFGRRLFAPSEGPHADVELAESIARQREAELR